MTLGRAMYCASGPTVCWRGVLGRREIKGGFGELWNPLAWIWFGLSISLQQSIIVIAVHVCWASHWLSSCCVSRRDIWDHPKHIDLTHSNLTWTAWYAILVHINCVYVPSLQAFNGVICLQRIWWLYLGPGHYNCDHECLWGRTTGATVHCACCAHSSPGTCSHQQAIPWGDATLQLRTCTLSNGTFLPFLFGMLRGILWALMCFAQNCWNVTLFSWTQVMQ